MSFQYLLTLSSKVLLEKLTGSQLVNKFLALYGTRRFITAFTIARHLSLPWARSILPMPPHPTSWRSTLILSSHLRLGLPSGLFPSAPPPPRKNSARVSRCYFFFFRGKIRQALYCESRGMSVLKIWKTRSSLDAISTRAQHFGQHSDRGKFILVGVEVSVFWDRAAWQLPASRDMPFRLTQTIK
jgi:hypothetical protein